MNTPTGPSCLFKFGHRPHLEEYRTGSLYLKLWHYFRNTESVIERDGSEGTNLWFNSTRSVVSVNGHTLSSKGGFLNASLSIEDRKTRVFCMSMLRTSVDRVPGPIFDERTLRHGDHVLVVWNVDQFVEKVRAAVGRLIETGVLRTASAEAVEYFDEKTYHGNVGPFRKSDRFSHEKEWRLAVETVADAKMLNEPFRISLEPIHKHSVIMPLSQFRNRIEEKPDGSLLYDL